MSVVSSLSSVADGCSSGNLVLPVQIYKIPCRSKWRRQIRISIRYYAAPLTSFWFQRSKKARPIYLIKIDQEVLEPPEQKSAAHRRMYPFTAMWGSRLYWFEKHPVLGQMGSVIK
jgi:hypothetical protein